MFLVLWLYLWNKFELMCEHKQKNPQVTFEEKHNTPDTTTSHYKA